MGVCIGGALCVTGVDDAMHTVSSSSVMLLQNLKLIIEGCSMKLQLRTVHLFIVHPAAAARFVRRGLVPCVFLL